MPFIIEGAFQGGLRGDGVVVPPDRRYHRGSTVRPDLNFFSPEKALLFTLTCITIGSIGSFAALRRFLKVGRWRVAAFVTICVVATVVLTNGELRGQSTLEKRIGKKQSELSDIKGKIADHRRKAKQLKKNEQSLLSKIKTLDKEIDLQRQFLRNLREQEGMMALHIDSLQGDIAYEESTLTTQEEALSRRIRQMYKRDPNHRW